MKVFHQCQSTIGWQPVRVESATQDGKIYIVHVNPWQNVTEDICECPAYIYRGHCRHQEVARSKVCMWHELLDDERQDEEERKAGQCPRCGGPTIRQVIE